MSSALSIVKKFFPAVEEVRDAGRDLTVEVTKADSNSAAVRKHNACAMAVACKRKVDADGVIVSIGTVYVVKGKRALRYKPSEMVKREVVSFDRNGGFARGEYVLYAPAESEKLGGSKSKSGNHHHSGTGKPTRRHRFTSGIRTALGAGLTEGDVA